jgi:hypothetical protein
LAADYPIRILSASIGNTGPIAATHKSQVTDHYFARATGEGAAKSGAEALQSRCSKRQDRLAPRHRKRKKPSNNRAFRKTMRHPARWRKVQVYAQGDSNPCLLAENQTDPQLNERPRKAVAERTAGRCTSGCTSEGESEHANPVATLAAALLALSPADRARLAALLNGQGKGAAP